PRIEPGFRKRADKNVRITDLDVSNTSPESPNLRCCLNRAKIIVMQDPAGSRRLTIQPREFDELACQEAIAFSRRDVELGPVRATEGFGGVIEVDPKHAPWQLATKVVFDLPREWQILCERQRADL